MALHAPGWHYLGRGTYHYYTPDGFLATVVSPPRVYPETPEEHAEYTRNPKQWKEGWLDFLYADDPIPVGPYFGDSPR